MKNVLGIIMAFDRSSELRDLTDDRCVGAIPFGGRYRIIDFMLSNMVNSNINSVGIVLRDQYQSLIDHIGNGKDWDLARKIGGISILPPFSYSKRGGLKTSQGTNGKIEGLVGISDYIKKSKAEYVVISGANIITNIDLSKVVEQHVKSEVDITCVCTHIKSLSSSDTYFDVNPDNSIKDLWIGTEYAENYRYSGLGIYVIKKSLLEKLIPIWTSHNMKYFEQEGLTLAMKSDIKLGAYIHDAYTRKVTNIRRYYDANMDLLDKDVREALFLKSRPIFTKVHDEQPTYYSDKAIGKQSLIADGCTIEGTVENSIIFRDVHIKEGAVVKNSIVLQGGKICSNASISNIIADKSVNITEDKTMMGHRNYPIVIAKFTAI
ncbi:MAG: glucose-1-phosphate adenylyltransferase subunit GlgD [Clostridia bacterium]